MTTTPRKRRHAKTKQAILNAARAIIRTQGADSLTMRQIADEIDYSAAGLYEYFGGKDAIIDALCVESNQRLRHYLLVEDGIADPIERLVECGLGYIRFAMNHPEEFMLLMNNRSSGRSSLADTVSGESAYSILLQYVQEAVDAGAIDASMTGIEGVAYSSWAFVHGMSMLRLTHLRNFEADFDSVHRWALTRFFQGIRGQDDPAEQLG